jgi:hypothetical protein
MAERGLLLLFLLLLFGLVTGVVIGGLWLVVWAPQLLLVGGVIALGCAMLAALLGTISGTRR